MGIDGLWSLLERYEEVKDLHSLRGLRLAIDGTDQTYHSCLYTNSFSSPPLTRFEVLSFDEPYQ
jgi:hypothetical protein